MNLSTPHDPVTITNLPFDPVTGEVLPNRVRPNQAGFGAASGYQGPRTVQLQVRFLVLKARRSLCACSIGISP